MESSKPSTIRALNKTLILNVIRQDGPISRARIAKKTSITRASVSEIVNDLLEEKSVFERGEDSSSIGRKGTLLNFNASLGFGIGVDIGGTKISLSLFDLNAELLAHKKIPTFQVSTNEVFINLMVDSIKQFISENDRTLASLHVIGIATPGIVDYKNGIVVEGSPNLPGWENLNVSRMIEGYLGVPVVVENNVRAALVGEVWKGQCRNVQSAVLISLGTGIGSALLMDGNIIRGAGNGAGEIGYMLLDSQHLKQDWDNKGCFETLCSGSSFAGRTSKWETAAEIFDAARSGDREAKDLIDDFVAYLSIVVINLIAAINPEKVILMGGLSKSADQFLPQVNENIRRHTLTRTKIELIVSDMAELIPLYGIAILALNKVHPAVRLLNDIKLM